MLFDIQISFSKAFLRFLFLGFSFFSDSVISVTLSAIFLILGGGGGGSLVFFYRAFLSGSVLSSTPYVGLLCLLRLHALNSCVGDT